MQKFRILLLAMTVAMATAAQAQDAPTPPSDDPAVEASAKAAAQAKAGTAAAAATEASAEASARAEIESRKRVVLEKGERVSTKAREKAERKLERSIERVNEKARAAGEAEVATRMAAEFRTSAEVLAEERSRMKVSWGELMVARCLAQNAASELTAHELCELRRDGAGWGQIAAGLGLDLGQTVKAVNSEARVAQGIARADGKVAAIGGPGSRASIGAASHAGLGASTRGVNAGASAGGTIRIKN